MMDRVLVLVDEANLSIAAKKDYGRRVDWEALRDYLADPAEGRRLLEMVVYIGMPPTAPEYNGLEDQRERFVHWLRSSGFMVVTRQGSPGENGSYKANVDVTMAIDAMDLVQRMRPDIVVLVTGDGDFGYLARTLRRNGIRVEAAAMSDSLSSALRVECNGVIDLAAVMDRFPAIGNGQAARIGSAESIFD
jgi:uncharacterized LabA/DUF88 family protein